MKFELLCYYAGNEERKNMGICEDLFTMLLDLFQAGYYYVITSSYQSKLHDFVIKTSTDNVYYDNILECKRLFGEYYCVYDAFLENKKFTFVAQHHKEIVEFLRRLYFPREDDQLLSLY